MQGEKQKNNFWQSHTLPQLMNLGNIVWTALSPFKKGEGMRSFKNGSNWEDWKFFYYKFGKARNKGGEGGGYNGRMGNF